MPITLTSEQREAFYEEVLTDLTGTRDISVFLEKGQFELAQEYRRQFEGNARLLDDIGWEPEDDRDVFPLTMPADELAQTLRRIHATAGELLQERVLNSDDERDLVERWILVQTTCGDALAEIAAGVAVPHPSNDH